MSFLVPLYLAGLAAASLPLVLHLVRRTPRSRQEFSSLMFLTPTPPRVTRRSRLEQLLLLALRITALVLLAAAFARPFLREAAALSLEALPGRRLAILLDASASMRRADLWSKALEIVGRQLDDLGEHEDVALYAFDDRLRTIVEFQSEEAVSAAGKSQLVRQQLPSLQPGWAGTDLGAALIAVAGDLDASTDVRGTSLTPQIVVVSDFQKGARLEALQSFEWPAAIPVVLKPVTADRTTNASARLLPSDEEADDAAAVRVRVANAVDSQFDQFRISWDGGAPRAGASADVAVYVPPGQSRVVRLPRPPEASPADRILLRGDDHDFDNTFYVVPRRRQKATILYLGADSADSVEGLLYFFRLAVDNDPGREIELQPVPADKLVIPREGAPQIVIVSRAVSGEERATLKSYVEQGGTVLFVPRDETAAQSLSEFPGEVATAGASLPAGRDYLMLGEIDFDHPLFAPFRDARYNDFTRIHFWKRRRFELPQPSAMRVPARFDDGSPAVLERSLGAGRVWVLASGWHPEDSQLALSSKFVPLMVQVVDLACGVPQAPSGLIVNDPVPPAPDARGKERVVRAPDGSEYRPGATDDRLAPTAQPGIYTISEGGGAWQFAVNLAAEESETTPLDLEQLEQRGVVVKHELTRAQRVEQVRQQRDLELESRQRIWRWLIAAALLVLILETWRAGWVERRQNLATEVAA